MLVDHWTTHFGIEKTEAIATSYLTKVGQTVRVNLTRISIDDAIRRLVDDDYIVEQDRDLDICLHVTISPSLISMSSATNIELLSWIDTRPSLNIRDSIIGFPLTCKQISKSLSCSTI